MTRSEPIHAPGRLAAPESGFDFSTANQLALVCAALLLVAFIFMPWLGRELAANGARLLSDNLYGTPGAPPVPLLWLVPLTACAALALALWGVWVPNRARFTSRAILALGLVGLAAIGLGLAEAGPAADRWAPGAGLWLALGCSWGLVLQAGLGHPALAARLLLAPRLLARLPAVPRSAVPYLFVLPGLALYAVWIIGPAFYTGYMSLTQWDMLSPARFVGLENFRHLILHDRIFGEALANNLRWLAVFITVPTTLGLALALVFGSVRGRRRILAGVFYAPLVLSLPVIGLMWAWLYNPRLGLINTGLLRLGFAQPDLPGWLGERDLALWCIIAAAVWRQAGYVMVLYAAGLRGIDQRVVEAALVDGAQGWKLLRHVLLPMLAPVTTILLVISVIDSLRAFDLVAIMTRGGQGTQVLANVMYMEAFNNYRMGYAAAIGVVLFAICLVFIGLYLWRVLHDEAA